MTTAVALAVSLEVGCTVDDRCSRFAQPTFEQMSSGRYDECSVQPVPESLDEWETEHGTASKRARRALKRGYYATRYRREQWTDHIHAINTSMDERQGRPMTSGYSVRQQVGPLPEYRCHRHAIRTWGVFAPSRDLVGYMTLYRVGELVLVSQILGHGDHLRNEIMWLLFAVGLEGEVGNPGTVVYNRHDSGTDGLRWFKERLGFRPMAVEWLS